MIAVVLLAAGVLVLGAYLVTGPECDCTRCERGDR